eukprot:18615-Hanusia_phi.AAC.1
MAGGALTIRWRKAEREVKMLPGERPLRASPPGRRGEGTSWRANMGEARKILRSDMQRQGSGDIERWLLQEEGTPRAEVYQNKLAHREMVGDLSFYTLQEDLSEDQAEDDVRTSDEGILAGRDEFEGILDRLDRLRTRENRLAECAIGFEWCRAKIVRMVDGFEKLLSRASLWSVIRLSFSIWRKQIRVNLRLHVILHAKIRQSNRKMCKKSFSAWHKNKFAKRQYETFVCKKFVHIWSCSSRLHGLLEKKFHRFCEHSHQFMKQRVFRALQRFVESSNSIRGVHDVPALTRRYFVRWQSLWIRSSSFSCMTMKFQSKLKHRVTHSSFRRWLHQQNIAAWKKMRRRILTVKVKLRMASLICLQALSVWRVKCFKSSRTKELANVSKWSVIQHCLKQWNVVSKNISRKGVDRARSWSLLPAARLRKQMISQHVFEAWNQHMIHRRIHVLASSLKESFRMLQRIVLRYGVASAPQSHTVSF